MPLSEAERRALERLVSAPTTPQALALRARIVLASSEESISTVARSLGVSRNTALKWRTRFDTDGLPGLADLPRPGRPIAAGDDVHRAILRMPLQRPPDRGWTTRTIADALGTNQAAVSRVRHQWFADRPDLVSRAVLDSSNSMVLAAVLIDPRVRVLVFHPPATPAARPRSRQSSALPESVRVLLSARFAFPRDTPASGNDISPTLLTALGEVDSAVPPDRPITVLADRPSPPRVHRWLDRHPRFGVYEVGPDSWLAQLNSITAVLDPRQTPGLLELAHEVRRWAEQPTTPFFWVRASPTRASRRSATDDDQPRSPSPRLASAVVDALRESLATGAFRPGQRIAEQPLATRLGVSRGPIRDALKILAEDGLIELEPHRGAYVPLPTPRDVYDTYTARGPLGALLLRRVATNGSSRLTAAKDALDDLVRHAEMHDVAGTGDADIRWQDALAAAADMPRIEKMFVRLSLQLRMFVSILGLEYAYSVDEIVADDTAIMRALEAQDPEEVTRLWRRKIDNAVTYMVGQLGHLD
ncbi:GntR family transcriptional regulator [Rhodococcus pseudokoreensis]|uniref:GntR family transcriptional regulator n=1 Tax=Rhodococcus pseudokoreensis TaxID=2811421 RepID=A0A974W6D6_9NOCA|nr:helix-turn-helix domain-containing protein [Rhodococcus pseudokoreensis]QSE91550.1 GntR family transcriptional regulator [Rhodococcus pseudokoreensis]